jgi:aspartate-semialdehyde dehydrogenase
MVVADANGHVLTGFAAPGVIACPDSQVVQAVLALQPVLREAGVQSVAVATYQSMSTLDQDAVEGLALQTGRLLNGQPPEAGALAKQAAFNLIPRIGDVDEHGFTLDEARFGEDVRRVLELAGVSVAITCVVVPVFYGTAAVMQLRTREVLTVKRLATLLRKSPGIKLLDKPTNDGFPTPITEATGSDAVWIGRLRQDPVDPLVLNMWIVSDNLRKGVVLNSLETLRLLIKDYL